MAPGVQLKTNNQDPTLDNNLDMQQFRTASQSYYSRSLRPYFLATYGGIDYLRTVAMGVGTGIAVALGCGPVGRVRWNGKIL